MASDFEADPGGMHDDISADELRRLEQQRGVIERAKYHEDVAVFRASVIKKFVREQALRPKLSWMNFHVDATSSDSGIATLDDRLEILFLMQSHIVEYTIHPHIRIILNQLVRHDKGQSFFTEDIVVDHENDAGYLCDAVAIDDEGNLDDNTLSPTYRADEEGIRLGNFSSLFTPIATMGDSEVSEHEVTPFGTYVCLEDKIYALEQAKRIFGLIEHQAPVSQAP